MRGLTRRALLAGLGACALPALPAAAADPGRRGRIFDMAWARVARDYWDPALVGMDWDAARDRFRPRALAAADEAGFYRALNAMLALLGDSHVYAEAPAPRRLDEERRAGIDQAGFGIATEDQAGQWRIYAVQPGSPAAAGGVEIGWTLRAVGGRPPDTDWHPVAGERVTLDFADEAGAARSVVLAAAPIAADPLRRAERLAGGLLWLRLDGFERGDGRWIGDEIEAAGPAGVILDLRENGGGEALEGARVAGRFFAEKRTLLRRIGRRRSIDVPILSAGARAWTGPLAVLIGPHSASAAEAVAALVAESGRGTTLGERSAGALTGAVRIDLPDGGLLSIAEADVRTPGGTRIEGIGLEPMVRVAPTLAERRAGHDPVLARAAALLA